MEPLENNEFKENPFRMPDGYLENMEASVLRKISEETASRTGWRTILRPAIYLAAMFAMIFGIGYGVMALTHSSERLEQQTPALMTEVEDSQPSEEDMEYYVNEYITVNEIITYLAQE